MAARNKAPSFENFTTFSEDFERYCRGNGNIMDVPLLYLVKNTFGYRTITLSHYHNSQFAGVEVVGNLDVSEAKEAYLRSFQPRDPFAAYINRTCEANPGVNTLQSSEVFAGNYFGSEYYQFLRTYGVWWALTMPIGEYRLTLYRHEDESDFTHDEREAVKLLGSMIRNRYGAQQEVNAHKTSGDLQSRLLDSVGIGLVSANNRMAVVSCNGLAAEYLKKVGRSNSVQYCFDQLCNLLRRSGARKPGVNPLVTMEHMEHSVTMEIIDGGAEEDMLYSITILPLRQGGGQPVTGWLAANLGLTGRELEVAKMLVAGKSYQEAADALFVSINTVRTHVRNIYKKTGITNQRMLGQLLR